MYIVQTAFRSVHGRYYPRGKEVSWLRRQLMAKVDKKFLVTREQYVSAYEEEYRREVQERDEDLRPVGWIPRPGYPNQQVLDFIPESRNYTDFNASPLVGEAWTPDEDFHTGAHYVPPEPVMEDPGVLDNGTPLDDDHRWEGPIQNDHHNQDTLEDNPNQLEFQWDGSVDDHPSIQDTTEHVQMDDGPTYESPSDSASSSDSYDSSSSDSYDSSSSDSSSSDSSSSGGDN